MLLLFIITFYSNELPENIFKYMLHTNFDQFKKIMKSYTIKKKNIKKKKNRKATDSGTKRTK